MNTAQKVLIFGGLTLATFGMLYGLYYALFVEHQTLDRMGSSLAVAFVHAAEGHLPEADSSVESYASTKYDYVRQVDVHSHWIGLGILLMLMSAIFHRVAFSLRMRVWIAVALLAGASVFPLGVLLQTFSHGSFLSFCFRRSGFGFGHVCARRGGLGPGCERRRSGNSPIGTVLPRTCNPIAILKRSHWSLLKWIARRVISSC